MTVEIVTIYSTILGKKEGNTNKVFSVNNLSQYILMRDDSCLLKGQRYLKFPDLYRTEWGRLKRNTAAR